MADPRIAIIPPHARTAGPQVTRLAAVAGIRLDQAQQLIVNAITGVDASGKWSAFENVIFQPRQGGKTEVMIVRALAGLFLFNERLVVFSAHQARTTSKVFRRIKQAIEHSPELGGRIVRVSNRSGAEALELATGQQLECVARSTGTGRGFTGDAILLDESQDLDGEQLAAILPMLSTVENPAVVYALSQGNENSTHLGQLRSRALARQDPHVCWIEWSMAEGDRIDDRDVWARCNPAYPERISMSYMEREWLALGPEQFARERLGKSNWPQDQTGRFAVISRDAWQACEDPAADARASGWKLSFGVAVSRDGRSAAIMACGGDRLPVLEVADWRAGDGAAWVGPRLADLTRRHDTGTVCWDDDSLAGQLGLAGYCGKARALTPKPGELAGACGAFMFAVEDRAIRHPGEAVLTAAVGAASVRPSRAAWYWDDRAYAAELIQAATWALHGRMAGVCPYDLLKSVC